MACLYCHALYIPYYKTRLTNLIMGLKFTLSYDQSWLFSDVGSTNKMLKASINVEKLKR